MPRRFPPPWKAEDTGTAYAIGDASGFTFLWVCYRHRPGPVGTDMDLLEKDEARRIAANIAKLPELLKGLRT